MLHHASAVGQSLTAFNRASHFRKDTNVPLNTCSQVSEKLLLRTQKKKLFL